MRHLGHERDAQGGENAMEDGAAVDGCMDGWIGEKDMGGWEPTPSVGLCPQNGAVHKALLVERIGQGAEGGWEILRRRGEVPEGVERDLQTIRHMSA